MKKKYYLLFYKLSHFFNQISDDKLNKFKALIVINALCMFLLVELLTWWTLGFNSFVDIPKFSLFLIAAIIVFFNYKFLMSDDIQEMYNKEFSGYSKNKHILINWLVFFVILLVIVSFSFSLYQLNQANQK